MTSYKYLLRAFLSLNSILSFDPLYYVSPPLCLSTHIEDIDIPYIEMLATLYPFFLLVLAFILIELHARDFKPVVALCRPLHQKLIRFRRSWNPRASLVQSFVNTFQGCYKDGLNGTRDYRAMSGGILALIVVMVILWGSADMLVEVSDRQPIISKQLTIWLLIALTVMMATLRPYKSETANHTAVYLTALLAAIDSLYI